METAEGLCRHLAAHKKSKTNEKKKGISNRLSFTQVTFFLWEFSLTLSFFLLFEDFLRLSPDRLLRLRTEVNWMKGAPSLYNKVPSTPLLSSQTKHDQHFVDTLVWWNIKRAWWFLSLSDKSVYIKVEVAMCGPCGVVSSVRGQLKSSQGCQFSPSCLSLTIKRLLSIQWSSLLICHLGNVYGSTMDIFVITHPQWGGDVYYITMRWWFLLHNYRTLNQQHHRGDPLRKAETRLWQHLFSSIFWRVDVFLSSSLIKCFCLVGPLWTYKCLKDNTLNNHFLWVNCGVKNLCYYRKFEI